MNSYNIPLTREEQTNDPAPEAEDVDKWWETLGPIDCVSCGLASTFSLDPHIGTKAVDWDLHRDRERGMGSTGTTLFLEEVALSSGLGV